MLGGRKPDQFVVPSLIDPFDAGAIPSRLQERRLAGAVAASSAMISFPCQRENDVVENVALP